MKKLVLFALCAFACGHLAAQTVPPLINYQGQLSDANGNPLPTADYTLTFTIHDAAIGGSQVWGPQIFDGLGGLGHGPKIPVVQGFFNVLLGPVDTAGRSLADAFNASNRWVQIRVGNNAPITPRQQVLSAPFALRAESAEQLKVPGSSTAAVKVDANGNVGIGTPAPTSTLHIGPQDGNHLFLSSANSRFGWLLDTLDLMGGNVPLRLLRRFDGTDYEVMRFDMRSGNLLLSGALVPGVAHGNQIAADFGAIGGGEGNSVGAQAAHATIGGGRGNTIEGGWWSSATIGGGGSNTVKSRATHATIAGGEGNTVNGAATHATIGGGTANTVGTNNWAVTIAGGANNTIGPNAHWAAIGGGQNNRVVAGCGTIPGGRHNSAAEYAFAAGYRAKANHPGAFVWGDLTDADIASTDANSVTMRASGGYRLFSDSGATRGVTLWPYAGSWTSVCDRNAKEDFRPVNPLEVLNRVVALPVTMWKYTGQDASIRHIGPTAQDFHAAFGVGESDTGITCIDADGVALAAIQGLNQKLETRTQELEASNRALAERNAALEKRVAELKALVQALAEKLNGAAP